MLVARTCIGDQEASHVATRLANAHVHRVVLSDTERQRSRVRTETTDGTDIGIIVADELGNGDVLETEEGDLVVVELAAVDALVLDIEDADISLLEAVELGHALGNRHWDLAIRDGELLFPVPDTRERMRTVITEHLHSGIELRFEAVPPTTFDDDTNEGHAHTHGEDGHSHGLRTIDEGPDG